MTGPEHYRRAEEFVGLAAENDVGSGIERYHLDAAQVHATLALAAATAYLAIDDMGDWHEVIQP